MAEKEGLHQRLKQAIVWLKQNKNILQLDIAEKMGMTTFGLSDTDEWTSDVVLKSLDDDGKVLGQVTLSGAPFKRNRATEYSGNLFGSGGGIDVSLNDTWEQSFTAEW